MPTAVSETDETNNTIVLGPVRLESDEFHPPDSSQPARHTVMNRDMTVIIVGFKHSRLLYMDFIL